MLRWSIRKSVRSALELATEKGYRSIAFQLIGAGTGGASQEKTLRMIQEEIEQSAFDGEVTIVKFKKTPKYPVLNHFEARDEIVANLRSEGFSELADSLATVPMQAGTGLEFCFILLGLLRQIQKSEKSISIETRRLINDLVRDLHSKTHK